jgi:hypothetical protein
MMRTRFVAGFVVAAATGQLAAQNGARMTSYQFELAGGWSMSETDTSPEIEVNQYILVGTYHLKPVMLADHPWNEAAFLEHSTFVQAGAVFADFEVGNFSADGPLFLVGGTYAEKDQPIAAQFNLQLGTLDGDGGIDIDLTSVNGRLGYWLQPNALIGAQVTLEQTEIETVSDVDTLSFGAFGKIVHDLGEGRAVNAEAHLDYVTVDDGTSDEENVEFGFAADFYFTTQYSLGAFVDFSFGDAATDEGTTLGVRGTAWIIPQLAVNFALSTFDADDPAGFDEDTIALFFTGRF